MKVLEPPLDAISKVARPYPAWVLDDCETGLCLFSAAFLGHNDAIHFARAGLTTTCVDVDGDKLDEMEAMYPDNWVFYKWDAWEFATAHRGFGMTYDVVSLDPFTNLFDRVAADLPLWCSLARKAVVVGASGYLPAPDGWMRTLLMYRARNVNWLVLERA